MLTIWEPGNEGFAGGTHVGHGGSVKRKRLVVPESRMAYACMASMSVLTVQSSAAEASAYFGVGPGDVAINA